MISYRMWFGCAESNIFRSFVPIHEFADSCSPLLQNEISSKSSVKIIPKACSFVMLVFLHRFVFASFINNRINWNDLVGMNMLTKPFRHNEL